MSAEKKPCVRCQRAIDGFAKICPFCNWDQSDAVPSAASQEPAGPAYVPPPERNLRRRFLMLGGGVALLVVAFIIGFFVHGKEPPPDAPKPLAEQVEPVRSSSPRADVTLVPVTDIEQPITSAPLPNLAEGVPAEYQRSDATAVASAEYAQLAARAQEERRSATLVDPRTLTGPAYAQTARRPQRPAQETENKRISIRTRPVPEYQPVPHLSVDQTVTARLELTIGADGRVKEVNLRDSIPGQSAKLIAAVQSWRFKPATENGVPVEAPFVVDLSFRGNE